VTVRKYSADPVDEVQNENNYRKYQIDSSGFLSINYFDPLPYQISFITEQP